jgi:signal transduction histidine kinase
MGMNASLTERRWLRWGAALALWTVIGLAFASQFYLSSSKLGRPVSWGQAVSYSLADWYVFAALSAPVIWLARRLRFERVNWARRALAHGGVSAVFSVAYMVLRAWVAQAQSRWSGPPVGFAEAFEPLVAKTFLFNVIVYWVIVAVWHALDYSRRFHERELRASELERRLAQARLQALQMQLNPHFLFNTLHALSSLMHRDVEAADRMLTRLGDLLRYALDSSSEQEVPLRRELRFLQSYLEIEQTRLGERLRVDMDFPPETLDLRVPNLILQPLVENAVRHGIEPQRKPGCIRLRARTAPGRLILEVSDNGVGLAANAALEEGVGLSNTRARLAHLYGPDHGVELLNDVEGGLTVRLILPSRVAENG